MIYLVRHGQTQWNAEGRIQGSQDSPLTDLGLNQITCVSNKLKTCLQGTPSFFSSPLPRARITAEIIKNNLMIHNKVIVSHYLAEKNYGSWEGLRHDEIPEAEKLAYKANKFSCAPHGGETYEQLIKRINNFVCLVQILQRHNSEFKEIVVVGHQTTNRVLLSRLIGVSWKLGYKMKNDDLIIVDPEVQTFEII